GGSDGARAEKRLRRPLHARLFLLCAQICTHICSRPQNFFSLSAFFSSLLGGVKMATTYEVRFQTVDPDRRAEYVKMYKQAIQEIKLAGCRGGLILCSEN